MHYSVSILRKFQWMNCCKEITENIQNIVKPHREVIISVVIGFVRQPVWTSAPLEIFKNAMPRGVTFQLSISFAVVSSSCEMLWRTKLQKPQNVQHFLFCELTPGRKSLVAANFKGCASLICQALPQIGMVCMQRGIGQCCSKPTNWQRGMT